MSILGGVSRLFGRGGAQLWRIKARLVRVEVNAVEKEARSKNLGCWQDPTLLGR